MKLQNRIIEIKKRIAERKKVKDFESVNYWQKILAKLELKNISNN